MREVTRCFCQISTDKLLYWAKKKFVDKEGTVALMSQAKDEDDKNAIISVALLDIPDEELLKIMNGVNKSDDHILLCRRKTKVYTDRAVRHSSKK